MIKGSKMKEPLSNCCNAKVETETYMLGGFPGHEHYHPATRYKCSKCNKTLDFEGQQAVIKFYYNISQTLGKTKKISKKEQLKTEKRFLKWFKNIINKLERNND